MLYRKTTLRPLITHKYFIKGHSQNEGDSCHSLIERQVKRLLRNGPIYVSNCNSYGKKLW